MKFSTFISQFLISIVSLILGIIAFGALTIYVPQIREIYIKEINSKIGVEEKNEKTLNSELQAEIEKVKGTAELVMEQSKRMEEIVPQMKKLFGEIASLEVKIDKNKSSNSSLRTELSKLNNSIGDLEGSVNILSNGIKTLEERADSVSDRIAKQLPLINQGDYYLVGGHRFEALPHERRIILSNLRGLKLDKSEIIGLEPITAISDVKWTEKNPSMEEMQTVFQRLILGGIDAHIIVSEAAPVERTVWLEVYLDDTLNILHPSLDNELWSDIDDRSKVPSMFKTGEFGVTYNDDDIEVYQLVK